MPLTDNLVLIFAVLIAMVAGLCLGIFLSARMSRSKLADALQLEKQQAEIQLQNLRHENGLKETRFMLEQQQLKEQTQQLREQQEQQQLAYQQLQQQLRESQQSLNRESQTLATAQERNRQLENLPAQLAERDQQLARVQSESAALKAGLEQERRNFEQQLQLLQTAREELKREFENLANRIFENKHQQFSANSKSLLETTLDPIKNQLGEFRRKVEEVYEKENIGRSLLAQQVVELQKQAHKIGEDAVNLAQALKGNSKTQGNWGEVVLERLLEQSGLQKGREYETQKSFKSEEHGRQMPDVIIRLPENKDIIIDSKVSLVDYEKFCNSDDETERQLLLGAHVQSLRTHIRQLSIKDYEKLDGVRTLDFVFIFIPIEAAFLMALQKEPGLYREAYDRHIILVSPTTLLATLRTVENIWRYENQNKNAEVIAERAGALHDQFVLLLTSLDGIGTQLDKARDSYDKARKQLHSGRGNLVRRVEELRKLGAKTKKVIARELVEQADDAPDGSLLELTESTETDPLTSED